MVCHPPTSVLDYSGYEIEVCLMSAEANVPMKPFSDSPDEGERGSFCLLLRSYAVVCQFRTITLVSVMDDCRRLKRTVGLELIALHCIDAIVDNSGCE